MQFLDWSLPFEIMCYTSGCPIGAVLGQQKDKKPYVVYYASKTLNDKQMNAIIEKELLIVVLALDKFHSYILGSHIVIFTDYLALKYLLTGRMSNHTLSDGYFHSKVSILKSKIKGE